MGLLVCLAGHQEREPCPPPRTVSTRSSPPLRLPVPPGCSGATITVPNPPRQPGQRAA